jgi:hypothetical protein
MPANGGLLRIGHQSPGPKPAVVGAKSLIVSGRYLKYSRFRKTAAGDRFDLHCVAELAV